MFVYTRHAAVLAVGMLTAVLGTPGRAAAATEPVEIHDYHYEPHRVRIAPGDRVEWKNSGDDAHTVTSDDPDDEDFDSDELGNGDEYRHTFDDEGTYRYHCEIHDNMSGVVEVVDPATTTTSTSTTTTTAPAPTTTRPPPGVTTTAPPPPASAPSPPPETATEDAPAPTTSTSMATSTSTSTTTTTEPTTTTVPPPPPEAAVPLGPEVPPTTSAVDEGEELSERQDAAARSEDSDGGGVDAGTSLLLALLLGSGVFGGWTLWKLRRVRT